MLETTGSMFHVGHRRKILEFFSFRSVCHLPFLDSFFSSDLLLFFSPLPPSAFSDFVFHLTPLYVQDFLYIMYRTIIAQYF